MLGADRPSSGTSSPGGQPGRTRADSFAADPWTIAATGAPLVDNAAAGFDCRLLAAHDAGTHAILIGLVLWTAPGHCRSPALSPPPLHRASSARDAPEAPPPGLTGSAPNLTDGHTVPPRSRSPGLFPATPMDRPAWRAIRWPGVSRLLKQLKQFFALAEIIATHRFATIVRADPLHEYKSTRQACGSSSSATVQPRCLTSSGRTPGTSAAPSLGKDLVRHGYSFVAPTATTRAPKPVRPNTTSQRPTSSTASAATTTCSAKGGNDSLFGEAGNDKLFGGEGNDVAGRRPGRGPTTATSSTAGMASTPPPTPRSSMA